MGKGQEDSCGAGGRGPDPIMVRTSPGAGPDAGRRFRAFDKETGDVVWETTFPAGNVGSPITYMHGGKQYIVLPIGSLDHPGEWIALALPAACCSSSGKRCATMLPEGCA